MIISALLAVTSDPFLFITVYGVWLNCVVNIFCFSSVVLPELSLTSMVLGLVCRALSVRILLVIFPPFLIFGLCLFVLVNHFSRMKNWEFSAYSTVE